MPYNLIQLVTQVTLTHMLTLPQVKHLTGMIIREASHRQAFVLEGQDCSRLEFTLTINKLWT